MSGSVHYHVWVKCKQATYLLVSQQWELLVIEENHLRATLLLKSNAALKTIH